MKRAVTAFVRFLLIVGSVVNPYEDRIDLREVWVEIPTHAALEGDLRFITHGEIDGSLKIRVAREDDEGRILLATMPLALDSENKMSIPCGYFSRGGTYYLEFISEIKDLFSHLENKSRRFDDDYRDKRNVEVNSDVNNSTSNNLSSDKVVKRNIEVNMLNEGDKVTVMETDDTVVKSWKFEVSWPEVKLSVTPEHMQTYPERQLTAIIEFPKVTCNPIEVGADFWLELLYCGHSSGGAVLCDGKNTSSHAHVLYSEQMHGFPGRRTVTLRCELIGQAGDYYLTLRPAAANGPQDLASAFIKADWSDQFVLNVHGGSVFPCGEGVRVLFQYPECVLEGADRVRVFGRDGEKLQYVAERRVLRGQHTATFDCRLFSERYPEYCFVYVSQSVTGAVTDVRMDCLPTSPISEGGAGGWGEWSPWSSCPAPEHCSTRTRSRHRFCDSPPPAYGAKYCEGNAVELAACECTAPPWPGDSTGVVAEVGPRCRCGCVLHLAPSARLLAGSARACPSRSFWLLQAEEGLTVRLRMEAVRLPCSGQSLKARDGDSLGSPLLASWSGGDGTVLSSELHTTTDSTGVVEISGGRHILVELRSTDTSDKCAGGFLAHATQIEPVRNVSIAWASIDTVNWWSHSTIVRIMILGLAVVAAISALLLAIHSAHRNRAYQRAADKESLTDSDACSASLEAAQASGSLRTLVSEVAGGESLRRLLSPRTHCRLRESQAIILHGDPDSHSDPEDADNKSSQDDRSSSDSQATVSPENSSKSAPVGGAKTTPSPMRRSQTVAVSAVVEKSTTTPQAQPEKAVSSRTETPSEMMTSISSVSERENYSCSEKDRDSMRCDSRTSSASAATLTNGWYSPALSGVSAARVRNQKYSKEKTNRRLLKSDLSLSSHPEMEMDYYDYEVNNAGSVPGSYLGMDPAFLVWIPPIDTGDILREINTSTPIYEEILPEDMKPDPGSNKETPDATPVYESTRSERDDYLKTVQNVIDRSSLIHPLNFSITDLDSTRNKKTKTDFIPLKDLTLTRSQKNEICNDSTLKRIIDNAKEKRDSAISVDSDLQFADDSESSNEIKFADDDINDSNKFVTRNDLRV